MKAPPDSCSSCGAAAQPGQEYCLECGSRLVVPPRLSAVGHAWERRLGRYPGDWIWASLLLLLVAAGSATAGIVSARDTGTGGTETIVATSPIVTAPQAPAVVVPRQPTTTPAPGPAPRPKAKPRTALVDWPARDGYTVVIASIPARGNGLKDATATAKEVVARGFSDVGVLLSARFASLHPGYYVVFTGIYGTLEEAQTAVTRAAARFPNAYAREITR